MAESQRQKRVAESVRKILSAELAKGNLNDTVLDKQPITLTHVEPSPDLRHCRVFFTPLGGVAMVPNKEIKAALIRKKSVLQAALGRKLTMKFTPRLNFVPDGTFDEADKMNRLIHSLPEAADEPKTEADEDV